MRPVAATKVTGDELRVMSERLGEGVRSLNSKVSFNVLYSVSENLDAFAFRVLERLALSDQKLFPGRPVRMVCQMMKRLGVGHETEDAACGVAYPCNVPERAIGIHRPPAIGFDSIFIRVLHHDLVLFKELLNVLISRIEIALSMPHRKLYLRHAFCIHTRGIRIDPQANPCIEEVTKVISNQRNAAIIVFSLKTWEES